MKLWLLLEEQKQLAQLKLTMSILICLLMCCYFNDFFLVLVSEPGNYLYFVSHSIYVLMQWFLPLMLGIFKVQCTDVCHPSNRLALIHWRHSLNVWIGTCIFLSIFIFLCFHVVKTLHHHWLLVFECRLPYLLLHLAPSLRWERSAHVKIPSWLSQDHVELGWLGGGEVRELVRGHIFLGSCKHTKEF